MSCAFDLKRQPSVFTWCHLDNNVKLCPTAALQEGGIVEWLETTLKNQNLICEEIRSRQNLGNSFFNSVRKILSFICCQKI
jgi:hypothetical protein